MVNPIQNIFDEESTDYLPSNSRENQSEDDHESTDDGFDQFIDHQGHLSTSRQWLCTLCMTLFFFVLLIEIISIAKLWIIEHFFVLKHEKQTLSYIHKKFEGDRNNSLFSPIYFVGAPVFLPQHWRLLGPERFMPLKLLGMHRVNKQKYYTPVYTMSHFSNMQSVFSSGKICLDKFGCCHTEIKTPMSKHAVSLSQTHKTKSKSTSPSSFLMMPCT